MIVGSRNLLSCTTDFSVTNRTVNHTIIGAGFAAGGFRAVFFHGSRLGVLAGGLDSHGFAAEFFSTDCAVDNTLIGAGFTAGGSNFIFSGCFAFRVAQGIDYFLSY